MLKKILFTIFVSIVGLVVFVLAALMGIVNWPELFINETTAGYAQKLADGVGIHVSWDEFNVEARSYGFMNEHIVLKFKNLKVETSTALKHAAANEVTLGIGYEMIFITPRISHIGPIEIVDAKIDIENTGDKKKAEPMGEFTIPDAPKIVLPWFIKNSTFHPISIDVDSLKIDDGMSARASAKMNVNDGTISDVITNFKLSMNEGIKGAAGSVTVKSDSGFRKNDAVLEIKTNAALADGSKLNLFIDALSKKDGIEYKLESLFSSSDVKVDAKASGTFKSEDIAIKLYAKASIADNAIESVSIDGCALEFKKPHHLRLGAKLSLLCPIEADIKHIDLADEIEKVYVAPDTIGMEIKSTLSIPYPVRFDEEHGGEFHIKILPTKGRLVSTDGFLNVKAHGIPDNFPKGWSLDTDANIDFKLVDFQELVAALAKTAYSIPAPLSVLEGPLTLSIRGDFSSKDQISHVPVEFKSELRSKTESLVIDSDGRFEIKFDELKPTRAAIDADITLTDVLIELPDLVPVGLPRLYPDPRINTKNEADVKESDEEPFPFDYDIRIKTPASRPLRISSSLAKTPIPIHTNVRMTSDDMSGSIVIDNFKVNLFRRDAYVDSLSLTLEDPMDLSEIDGLVKVYYVDYTISIDLVGPISHPSIVLTSNPPLSKEDIMATLLYGAPFDSLDESDADSVGSMNNAFANKALALSSMYFLASTPIERVGYDPNTQTVSAKFKIAEGTSLTVGSDVDKKGQVGVRKRLGKGFVVSTTVDAPTERMSTGGAAFLEWHKRY